MTSLQICNTSTIAYQHTKFHNDRVFPYMCFTNRIFDDVMMTSHKYGELHYFTNTYQTYCRKNYDSGVFLS